jgi:hypothetical protein
MEISDMKRSNVPVHPLLEDFWDCQLVFSRRATGLLDCRLLLLTDLMLRLTLTLMVHHGQKMRSWGYCAPPIRFKTPADLAK